MTNQEREIVEYRIQRAVETLEDARMLAQSKRWNSTVNRLYYACFYIVSALLKQAGFSSSRHSGIRSLFNQYYVKTGKVSRNLARLYNDLFEWRHEGDYEDLVRFQESQVTPRIEQVEEFIASIRQLIQDEGAS